ncbi:MAG: chorismate synthase [Candidatus Thorarchaeota archaeon]
MIITVDNTLGTLFKITSFGESHGDLIGIVVDGTPAGFELDIEYIQRQLDMRKPGQSYLTSSRKEEDKVKVLSGIFNQKTTGAPICLTIKNVDVDSSEYEKFKNFLRPSHIDYTALKKYGGFSDYRGSGRFSGRITAGFVMAGAIAKQILQKFGIEIFAYTIIIGNVEDEKNYDKTTIENLLEMREKSLVRAVDKQKSSLMEQLVEEVKNKKDSIGGKIKCVIRGFPAGKGGPVFNSIESKISTAMFSIPAIKGIEFGVGFKSVHMKGSEHNDPWIIDNNEIKTSKNASGGIIGGISTGMPIEFSVAVKPPASIGLPQKTVDISKMKNVEITFSGRHDPCIVPRVVPVVEALIAVVLLDILLIEGFIPKVI